MLWGAVHGVAQLGKLSRLDRKWLAPDRLSEGLIHTLLVGWGARTKRAEEAIALVRGAQLGDPAVSAADLDTVAET